MSRLFFFTGQGHGGPLLTTTMRIQTFFVNSCLIRIVSVWWPEIISNERLWQCTCQMPVEQEIRQRRLRSIGCTLRKPVDSITRQALTWNSEGKRKKAIYWKKAVEHQRFQLSSCLTALRRINGHQDAVAKCW